MCWPKGPINILQFSDKGMSTRRLVCVDLLKVWCHSQKTLNKLHSYIAKIQQFITSKRSMVIYNKRKVINSKSLVMLTSKLLYTFFHIPITLINILPGA